MNGLDPILNHNIRYSCMIERVEMLGNVRLVLGWST